MIDHLVALLLCVMIELDRLIAVVVFEPLLRDCSCGVTLAVGMVESVFIGGACVLGIQKPHHLRQLQFPDIVRDFVLIHAIRHWLVVWRDIL